MPKEVTTPHKSCSLLLLGSFAAQHNRVLPGFDLPWVLFVAIFVLFLLRHFQGLVWLIVGFTLFTVSGYGVVESRLDPRFAGDSLLTRVQVVDFPEQTGNSALLMVSALDDSRIPARTRVSWHAPDRTPQLGEIWDLELRLRRPRGRSNPGGFSFEDWAFRERIQAVGYVVPGMRNQFHSGGTLSPLMRYRHDLVKSIRESAGDNDAILVALAVGSRHLLDRGHWDLFARTGTSHLMAISGLHIGLAALFAFTIAVSVRGVCRRPGNHLDRAALVGVIAGGVYATIAEFGVPSQRAFIMLALATFAWLFRRRIFPYRIVAMAAIAVFVIDPLAVMAPGFILSFAAVAVLLWGGSTFLVGTKGKVRKLIQMQLVLLLGLLPWTVLIFDRIVPVALPTNLVVVPLFSFVTVPLTLLGMLLFGFWSVGSSACFTVASWSIDAAEVVISGFAGVPFATVSIAGIGGMTPVALLLPMSVLWILLPRGWPGRFLSLIAVIAAIAYRPSLPPRDCFDATFVDIGQGQSVVIRDRQNTLVYDTGPSYLGGYAAAEQSLLPLLAYFGITSVSSLVISHADNDHAGGVDTLLASVSVGRIFAGEELAIRRNDVHHCHSRQSWTSGGVSYRFMYPDEAEKAEGNDSSCVLSIAVGAHSMLLTGDIESRGERDLLRRWPNLSADVVSIPHHGSLTSSSRDFVERVNASIAVASVGWNNRWGFPKPQVHARWTESGAQVMSTAQSGAVSLRLCARGGLRYVQEERRVLQRFWHDS